MKDLINRFGNDWVRWTGYEWEVVDEDYISHLKEEELKRLKKCEELWEKNKDRAVEI